MSAGAATAGCGGDAVGVAPLRPEAAAGRAGGAAALRDSGHGLRGRLRGPGQHHHRVRPALLHALGLGGPRICTNALLKCLMRSRCTPNPMHPNAARQGVIWFLVVAACCEWLSKGRARAGACSWRGWSARATLPSWASSGASPAGCSAWHRRPPRSPAWRACESPCSAAQASTLHSGPRCCLTQHCHRIGFTRITAGAHIWIVSAVSVSTRHANPHMQVWLH